MDCLRSFNFLIAAQSNMTAANGFEYWQIGTQHFWMLDFSALDSTFNIQGFKNVNIYKIEVAGDINSNILPVGFKVLVQNWNIDLQVVGQNAIIGGFITPVPNGFNMVSQPLNPIFNLSKFQRSIEFPTPIQSATSIIISGLYADGIANQSILSGQIEYQITVNVFYKYEGE
jgi:hypothetical protein